MYLLDPSKPTSSPAFSTCAKSRIVVKRPRLAQSLNEIAPAFSLEPVQNLVMLSQKSQIFENRSAAYKKKVCEQRIAENLLFLASIVRDFEQALKWQ